MASKSTHRVSVGKPDKHHLVVLPQYLATIDRKVMLDKSIRVGFPTGETGSRLLRLITGQPTWERAYMPPSGPTQSWAVTLAERA